MVFYITTCFGHSGHQVNHFTFIANYFQLFPLTSANILHLGGKVMCFVYRINASYSLHANLKYIVKIK
jgi:hypothetical protein